MGELKELINYNIKAFIAVLWKNFKIKYVVRRIYLLNETVFFLFFLLQVFLMAYAFKIEFKLSSVKEDFLPWALVGFLIWNISGYTTSGVSRALYNEMDEGMFPIVMTSPTPILLVVTAHMVTEVLIWIPITLITLPLVAYYVQGSLNLFLVINLTLTIVLLILAYIGVGLLLNAIVTLRPYLRFIVDLFNLITLLFSGTFFPVEVLPPEILWIALLLPVKHAIDISRCLVFGKNPAPESLYWLILLIVFYNILGTYLWLKSIETRRRGETWV